MDAINQGILEGSAIILAADSAPDEMIELLEREGLDTRRFIDRGVLTILDGDSAYSRAETRLEVERLQSRWSSIISRVKKKSNCNGILIIGSARVFFDTDDLEKLMEYERRVGKSFENILIDAICYLDADSFQRLSLAKIIHFLNCHEYIIYHGGVHLKWHPQMILELINRAIDGALGPDTSKLLVKTLELIYNIKDERVVSQPELYEEKLQKLFGKSSDLILCKIKKQVTAQLLYMHRAAGTDTESGK